jgi:carbonic anhydrase
MPENLIDFDAYVKELEVTATRQSTQPQDCDPKYKADVLLLTCMDFRFFLDIARRMEGIKYDHVILAGAALGAVVPAKERTWQPTFFDHLGLARQLHCIEKVIVMEHRGCGAYGPPPGFSQLPANPDREHERRVHEEWVERLRIKLPRDLGFESFLLEVPTPSGPITFDKLK